MMTAALLSVGPSVPVFDTFLAEEPLKSKPRRYYMQGIDHLQAKDIMRRTLISAHPNQPLMDVERRLIEAHISGMPVVEDDRLVGVISRSDIARVQVLTGALDGVVADEMQADFQADGFQHAPTADYAGFRDRFGNLKVRDAMRTQVVTCRPDTSVTDLSAAMLRHHIHRMIVVDGEKLVGIISSLDLVELVAKSSG